MEVVVLQARRNKTDEELLIEKNNILECVKSNYPDEVIRCVDSSIKGVMIKASPLWSLGQLLQTLSSVDLIVFSNDAAYDRAYHIAHICCDEYHVNFTHCVETKNGLHLVREV